MRARNAGLLAAALAAAIALWWGLGRHRSVAPAPSAGSAVSSQAPGVAPGQPNASPAAGGAAGAAAAEEPSHLADALNSPRTDIHADLRLLNDIFDQYRSATHALNPVGENVEITAALCGRNRLGFAFIPPNCPAINAKGELCDRWGTPFFFHSLSGTQMEIRSAGPDRKLWTADDEVLTPGVNLPHL